MPAPRILSLALALAATGSAGLGPVRAEPGATCTEGHTSIASPRAGAPLRFGVTAAGQVFSSQPGLPDQPARTLDALEALRGERPLLVRLNRFSMRNWMDGIDAFEDLARRYTDAGHEVTLQLRYGPVGGLVQVTPDNFETWVRAVVERLGANPGVVAVEVTNEPNLTTAPDNSDGAFSRVREALVRGVVAAKQEIVSRGYSQLTVGFNWFFETSPVREEEFWRAVGSLGGHAFADALDWIGLNAYPGTYDLIPTAPLLEDRVMVRALASLRACWLPLAGIHAATPIRVIENGFPNARGRTPEVQADTLERMVRAVAEHAAAYNVTHHLWFTLRDVATGSVTSYESNYGLLEDDYDRKPAFDRYRDLIQELG